MLAAHAPSCGRPCRSGCTAYGVFATRFVAFFGSGSNGRRRSMRRDSCGPFNAHGNRAAGRRRGCIATLSGTEESPCNESRCGSGAVLPCPAQDASHAAHTKAYRAVNQTQVWPNPAQTGTTPQSPFSGGPNRGRLYPFRRSRRPWRICNDWDHPAGDPTASRAAAPAARDHPQREARACCLLQLLRG